MNVGIIGRGVVGDAVYCGLSQIGNKMSHFDVKDKNTTILDVLQTDIVFVCVPTDSTETGNCDTSVVQNVIQQLDALNYAGIVAIKSTVIPQTTDSLIEKYPKLQICYVPEFLRQKSSYTDFFENHSVLIIGTHSATMAKTIADAHKFIPKSTAVLTPVEAEVTKYFNNVHNAMEIVFANAFFDVCEKIGANYQEVLGAVGKRENINIDYLKCSEFYRGYGGHCLPKDTVAWKLFANKLGVDVGLFSDIVDDNRRYIK